jgi:asparagine synthase (glutamine-hydrolysing)
LLSGGLDTSTIAVLLAEQARREGRDAPESYSIIFEDPEMSEWPYMQLVNAHGGLHGVHHVLTAAQAWDSADLVVQAQGQPLLGQDIIAQYHAYRLARERGCTVVLDGQGADELLAGMPLYEAQIFPEMLRRGRWLRFARELRARMQRYGLGLGQALDTYVRMPISRRRMERLGLPRYDWLDSRAVDSSDFGKGRTDDWGPGDSDLARFLYRHVRHTNLPQVLLLQDHASMSHAIESRVPFLDHRLVEFIFGLPDSFKVGRGLRKRILLETVRPILPRAVAERRDKRTFVSKNTWMQLRERRAQELIEMAASEELRDFGLVKPQAVVRFVADFLAGRHGDQLAVWRLYTFSRWLRLFRPAL